MHQNRKCNRYLYSGQLRSPDSPVSPHPSEPKEQPDPPLAAAGLYSLPAGGAPAACTPDSQASLHTKTTWTPTVSYLIN